MNANRLQTAILTFCILYQLGATETAIRQKSDNYQYSLCKVCKNYVDSFKKGMEKTSRGKFEGGDADWEEQRLGSYLNSEIRLVEIQEGICSNLEEGTTDCFTFNEEYEDVVEKWFFNEQNSIDLFTHLCVMEIKVCCPNNHYGTDCLKCLNCSMHGKCAGNGDRNGNGNCLCDLGYEGPNCNKCKNGYYFTRDDKNKIVCVKCHSACSNCTGEGPNFCLNCKFGFQKIKGSCVDINECLTENPCSANKFCINKEGTYACLQCDQSCKGCTSNGPENCISCAKDYTLNKGVCVDSKKLSHDLTPYVINFATAIVILIIFKKNIFIASLTVVGFYIFSSENIFISKKS